MAIFFLGFTLRAVDLMDRFPTSQATPTSVREQLETSTGSLGSLR